MATTNILDIYCPEVHPWSVPTLQHCNSITPGAWCRRCFWQRAFPHLRKLGSPKSPIAKVGLETGKLEDKSKKITSFGFQDILSLDARLCVGRDIFNWNEGRGWVGINQTIPYHTISYHTIPHHAMPYYAIPYHTMGGLWGRCVWVEEGGGGRDSEEGGGGKREE